MTRQEAQHILDNIKFPFVKFTTRDNPFGESPDSFTVVMVAKIPDNDTPDETITITQDRVMSTMVSHEFFVEQVWIMLTDWLQHEAGELFQVGEAFPYNQHYDHAKEARLMKAVFTRQNNPDQAKWKTYKIPNGPIEPLKANEEIAYRTTGNTLELYVKEKQS